MVDRADRQIFGSFRGEKTGGRGRRGQADASNNQREKIEKKPGKRPGGLQPGSCRQGRGRE
jgi:hypothetical protein